MANMPHRFHDRDIRRVIKCVQSVGLSVERIEVDPKSGRIVAGVREVAAPVVQDDEKAATA